MTISQQLQELAKNTEDLSQIDFNYEAIDNATNQDELRDAAYDAISEQSEVIYYATAIKYLADNDPSLRESLGIAAEYGADLENLNSEKLASLLKDRYLREDFDGLDLDQIKFDEASQRKKQIINQRLSS